MGCIWRSEDNFLKLVVSIHYVGPGGGVKQIICLGNSTFTGSASNWPPVYGLFVFLIEILQYYLFIISICLTKVKKLLNLAFSGELVGSTLSMCITYTFSKELEHPIM